MSITLNDDTDLLRFDTFGVRDFTGMLLFDDSDVDISSSADALIWVKDVYL
jgi:hypothetical protein